MNISSAVFENNKNIPKTYTCQGENHNPPLAFSAVPKITKSLVLIVDDPDAPMGTWVHWVLFNIPPHTNGIAEYAVPDGAIEGSGSGGKQGYQGPCPPSGTHRYFFKLYALDTTLPLSNKATKADVETKMQGHILGLAELIGLYKKE